MLALKKISDCRCGGFEDPVVTPSGWNHMYTRIGGKFPSSIILGSTNC